MSNEDNKNIMLDKLRGINKKLMELNKLNEIIFDKQNIIKKILSDDECFLKINIDTAYSILEDLDIPESEIKKVYSELIDIKNFKE